MHNIVLVILHYVYSDSFKNSAAACPVATVQKLGNLVQSIKNRGFQSQIVHCRANEVLNTLQTGFLQNINGSFYCKYNKV